MVPQGLRFRRRLHDEFSHVTTTRTVWANVPPAFVYRAVK
jgi:phosphatidylethanolamine/phosphatidyl-N-methylethanolamine N-methyltransferase